MVAKIRIDFHVHTKWSHDAFGDFFEISRWARFKGINAVVVTDHNRVTIHKPENINSTLFIPGIELKTPYGHVLGINLQDDLDIKLSKENPLEAIHEVGGFCVLAHPFDSRGNRKIKRLEGIDAIEVLNSSSILFKHNFKLSRVYAKMLNLPETAGSDSHLPSAVGDAFVEVEDNEFLDAMKSIFNGRGKIFGRPTSIMNRIKLNLLRITKIKF
ncbi:MAG: PHP-associated domain-containing protein [Nitrososphaerales archaeon]